VIPLDEYQILAISTIVVAAIIIIAFLGKRTERPRQPLSPPRGVALMAGIFGTVFLATAISDSIWLRSPLSLVLLDSTLFGGLFSGVFLPRKLRKRLFGF
jgi:hypothetical protein